MRIGLQVPSFTWPGGTAVIGPRLAEIARTAEDTGFFSVWVMDHFFQIRGVGQPEEPMLEGYSALGYIAGFTKRVKLGTMVTGVIYRYPGILVKTATTLDVLSGGRSYLGIGAAWFEREALGLGVPFPSLKERFECLEETLQIAKQMWSGEVAPYEGKHFHLAETLTSPQPLSKPHPPILIGGSGERKTLRLVAQYADGCNLFARSGVDALKHKLDVLRRHCDDFGRSYDEIEKTALDTVQLVSGQMNVDQVIGVCRTMADLGFQQIIFNMPNVSEIKPLEIFGKDIIPVVAGF
jgi:F420-dependent oxidoreductase-like protein